MNPRSLRFIVKFKSLCLVKEPRDPSLAMSRIANPALVYLRAENEQDKTIIDIKLEFLPLIPLYIIYLDKSGDKGRCSISQNVVKDRSMGSDLPILFLSQRLFTPKEITIQV